jgi:hypothetical protein
MPVTDERDGTEEEAEVFRLEEDYDPEADPAIAGALSRRGDGMMRVCAALRITKGTFRHWQRDYPEFAEAFNEGTAIANEAVKASLFRLATGYTDETVVETTTMVGDVEKTVRKTVKAQVKPDVKAVEFWLANRDKDNWRRKDPEQVQGPTSVTLNQVVLGVEERDTLLERLAAVSAAGGGIVRRAIEGGRSPSGAGLGEEASG